MISGFRVDYAFSDLGPASGGELALEGLGPALVMSTSKALSEESQAQDQTATKRLIQEKRLRERLELEFWLLWLRARREGGQARGSEGFVNQPFEFVFLVSIPRTQSRLDSLFLGFGFS